MTTLRSILLMSLLALPLGCLAEEADPPQEVSVEVDLTAVWEAVDANTAWREATEAPLAAAFSELSSLKGRAADLEQAVAALGGVDVTALEDAVTQLDADVSSNAADIVAHAALLADDATQIGTLTVDLSGVQGSVTSMQSAIAANGSEIASNTAAIAGNSSTIAANAAAVTSNTAGIGANAWTIGVNATAIATSAGDIATNAAGVTTNAAGISTNAAGISTNAAGIAGSAADIGANAGAIATNAAGLAAVPPQIASISSALTGLIVNVGSNIDDIADMLGRTVTSTFDLVPAVMGSQVCLIVDAANAGSGIAYVQAASPGPQFASRTEPSIPYSPWDAVYYAPPAPVVCGVTEYSANDNLFPDYDLDELPRSVTAGGLVYLLTTDPVTGYPIDWWATSVESVWQ